MQASSCMQLELAVVDELGAERFEDLDVRVDAAAADVVAAGIGGHAEAAMPCQQQPHQRERTADLAEEVDVRLG